MEKLSRLGDSDSFWGHKMTESWQWLACQGKFGSKHRQEVAESQALLVCLWPLQAKTAKSICHLIRIALFQSPTQLQQTHDTTKENGFEFSGYHYTTLQSRKNQMKTTISFHGCPLKQWVSQNPQWKIILTQFSWLWQLSLDSCSCLAV